MMTISTHNQKLNLWKHDYFNQTVKNVNHNATKSQLEHERDACEEELYRLRFGIENLLNNRTPNGSKFQQQEKISNFFRKIANRIAGLNSWFRENFLKDFKIRYIILVGTNTNSWFDPCCSPCCRRWRRYQQNNDMDHNHNNKNFDSSRHSKPAHSDSFVSTSTSRSPSVSSQYTDTNTNYDDDGLKHVVEKLVIQNNPSVSNLLHSNEINDPVYNSMLVKILEAKALDCLCAGYSKQNTQKQIENALSNISKRAAQQPLKSNSVTPSPSLSSSSVLSDLQTPNESQSVSGPSSPGKSLQSTKPETKTKSNLNGGVEAPRKKSNVTVNKAKTAKPKKPKKKNRSSSKRGRQSSNKSKRSKKTSSSRRERSKSSKKRSSPKSKKKSASRPSSKSKRSNKSKSRSGAHKKTKKKKSKGRSKSNNQMNNHSSISSSIKSIYPQLYEHMYQYRYLPCQALFSKDISEN
ncbi:unnamed protein product [Adineta ricciae]|uniref:Uncharacterized protein n=1 Tax=Adineta ricciae TaxID=249248 RepID=A0A815ZLW6_ADIRI|nr:unnamed protein product [Adineta ricciae]